MQTKDSARYMQNNTARPHEKTQSNGQGKDEGCGINTSLIA